MPHSFLLIGNPDHHWSKIVQEMIASLGEMDVCDKIESLSLVQRKMYDVIIVDAMAVEEAGVLVSRLRGQLRRSRIVIVTASPTWRRAREAFQAGAMDYIRISLDKNELLAIFNDILAKPVMPQHP